MKPLDEEDIHLLKNYGLGPYAKKIKDVEQGLKVRTLAQTWRTRGISGARRSLLVYPHLRDPSCFLPDFPQDMVKRVNELTGIKESDTGLAPPSRWDLVSDKQMMQEEQPLQVARCTKIINPNTDEAKYVINVKQIAKFVVGLGDKVAPTDIEEGMRVGVDRNKYQIQIPLPPRIDPSVTMMTVEEKPDVTYSDIGGSKEQIERMREVVELPLMHPEKFVQLGECAEGSSRGETQAPSCRTVPLLWLVPALPFRH